MTSVEDKWFSWQESSDWAGEYYLDHPIFPGYFTRISLDFGSDVTSVQTDKVYEGLGAGSTSISMRREAKNDS